MAERGLTRIHELFEAQATRTPNAVALECGDLTLSYAELDARSSRLAAALHTRGLAPDAAVALFVEKSADLVIGLLGILKSGATYVPLDPDHPAARIEHMLAENSVQWIVSHAACLEHIPATTAQLLRVDEIDVEGDEVPAFTALEMADDAAAYVVYTSGSTGRPKGIAGGHRGVVQYLDYVTHTFDLGPDDVVLQFPSPTFDASFRDIIAPLAVGARVVVPQAAEAKDPTALLDLAAARGVTCFLSLVPSVLSALVGAAVAQSRQLPSVRLLLVSGEPLQLALCHRARTVFGDDIALVNQYGPTECVMTSTYHRVTPEDGERGVAPIGGPIPGRRIYVLDAERQPVAPGATGEIHIGGPGLTHGYLGLPELTAGCFLDDPFDAVPGAHLYRTGDLARQRPDGVLEFLGRSDQQVKIGGVRIELGEIESLLSSHEAVRDCVVVARGGEIRRNLIAKAAARAVTEDEAEALRLVAFVTTGSEMPETELRSFLESRVPAAMVPSRIVVVPEMPLNANGKIDKNALPDDSEVRAATAHSYEAPADEVECKIAEAWRAVLKIDRVGRLDGFFELGGDSLRALQALNRLREVGIRVSFKDLFKTPTVIELAKKVRGSEVAERISIPPRSGEDFERFPLTEAQRGLWFLWRVDPENPFYMSQGIVQLRGRLDHAVLERAWAALFERHEVLRARFQSEDGEPIQVFQPAAPVALPITDLTHLPESERIARVHETAEREVTRPFDLANESLMRPQLFKLAEEEHALLVVMHEITFDLWSVRTVLRDLGTLYEGFLAGEAQPLEPLEVQIGDWARAERDALARSDMREHETYWRETLAGDLPVLDLPLDHARPELPTNHGAAQRVLLPAELSKRLVELSRGEDATLFMTLLAGWGALLRHYTGQDDIIVGAPLAKRNYEETEKLVGFFLNMMPLRLDLCEDPSIRELVRSVRDVASGAVTHADYPFARMLEWARAVRDPRFSPMFQVMFNMMAYTDESLQDGSLEIAYSGLETGYTKYDLSFYAQEHGDRIHLQISYLRDLFESETVERMLRNLVTLLEGFVANPDARLSEIALLDDLDRVGISGINETDQSYGDGASIHELFERQVARTPDAVALYFGDRSIRYRELDARASRLGATLHEAGVEPGVLVAVSVERSIETLVALLGILKAGGTYVALDPTYPKRRLEDIITDTQPAVLIAQRGLDDFGNYDGLRVILEDASDVEGPPVETPPCQVDPDQPLMLVYTSSSTGKPKGVPIPQSAVLNRLYWMWDVYPFKAGDVAVLHKSTALVASTWECFGALLQGIPTVVLSRDEQLDPTLLFDRVVKRGVTHFLATPSLIRGVLAQAARDPEAWRTLRFGTTSAEPIEPEMVMQWRELFPDAPLLNLYGATECSSNATVYDTTQLQPGARRVPIGRPLANVRVRILDEHLRPVPLGAAGEMCVSGACLGAGYLHQHELTAEHFVPNPFAEDPGRVLYRTGDVARLLPDGNFELLGRRDLQVKVRGFRVDLEDVESALVSHEEVRECAVVLRGDAGDQELVAHVVAPGNPTAPSLRRHLRERLPGYMVPAEFAFLEALPRTPNGKLDRRALPNAVAVTRERDDSFVAPRSDLEVRLARIFETTLEVEPVGAHDDFFELGGHSLLAVRVVDRIEESFGRRIPLPTLFQEPNVAGVARALSQDGAPDIQSALVPLREGSGTPLFCISGIALYRALAQHLPGGRPVYGIYLEDEMTAVQTRQGPAPERFPQVSELAASYVSQIRETQPDGPYALAGVSFGGFLAFEIAQQLRASGGQVALLALLDTSWPSAVRRSKTAFVKNALRRLANEGPLAAIRHAAHRHLDGDRSHVKLRSGAIDLQEQRAVAFRQVVRAYQAEPYPGRMVLFRAANREMPAGYEMEPLLGWGALATGEFSTEDVPGSHLGILEEPNVQALAGRLGQLLDDPNQRDD